MTGLPRTLAPLLSVTLTLGAGACGGPVAAPNRLWTLADLQFESLQSPCSNPGGLDCNYFIRAESDHYVPVFKLAFAEGQPMGYLTTDFWANYDRIWLQPMYFLVTAWNEKAPAMNRLLEEDNRTKAGPIFSVGPKSAFYSPFWSVFYVEVPPGTPPGKYTSARQLFQDGLPMHQGVNRFASIAPDTILLPTKDEIREMYELPRPDQDNGNLTVTVDDYLAPLTNPMPAQEEPLDRVVASSARLSGWLDGVPVHYFDFGADNFVANAAQEVQDVPLFLFTQRGPDGKVAPLGSPNVGGVAPLFSGVGGHVSPAGRPQFGGLWRIYQVLVPAAARMLDKIRATGAPDGVVPDVLKDRLMRVALNGDMCFPDLQTSQGATDKCIWLDSQRALEDNLAPSAFTRTGLQPACPFVMWKRVAVPNP